MSPNSANAPTGCANRAVDPSRGQHAQDLRGDGRAPRWTCGWSAGTPTRRRRSTSPPASIAGICGGKTATRPTRPDGRTHPVPGSLQIVFGDLGSPGKWNVYDELRAQLIERGLPAAAVRFIHEARNDQEKGELFAACREGTSRCSSGPPSGWV